MSAIPSNDHLVFLWVLVNIVSGVDNLDTCLYTAPGKYGGGGAGTTWLVGSFDEVADALRRYQALGINHFVLSDTPYKDEVVRVGDHLLAKLRDRVSH